MLPELPATSEAFPEVPAWTVHPSGPLNGDVRVRGSKNAATKHLVAALLGNTPSTLGNMPDIGDVDITIKMLRDIGAEVTESQGTVTVDPRNVKMSAVPEKFTGLNRIPILLAGPMLHQTGEVYIPMVGGDRIGKRPIDFHELVLKALGAEVTVDEKGLHVKGSNLQGAKIHLPYPSVGATETAILTAVKAEGRTVITNCAVEPEIVELTLFLQRMGALIEWRPERKLIIQGVDKLNGAGHVLAGDRIEAFSYLVSGLVTKGRVQVYGCGQERLVTAITTLRKMGADFEITDNWLSARWVKPLKPITIHTDTHPGFMTDWQAPLVLAMTQADGMSVIHETVYENRLSYTSAIKQMGAEIEIYNDCLGGPACRFYESTAPHSAVVRGVSKLTGSEITIPDIRGGYAYLIAAAIAEGESTLHNTHHLIRGYNQLEETFEQLGLRIEKT